MPKWAKRLLLSLTSFLLALGLCEIAVRLLLPKKAPESAIQAFIHQPSENLRLLYRPRPNMSTVLYHVTNHINGYGTRDHEFTVEKPEGVTRVVFLGDSLVYGFGVELEESIPKQLEKNFREAGHPVEVLNFGVSGYESEQQIEFFKELGIACAPDHVFVGYTLNDSRYASWELDRFDDLFAIEVKDPEAGLMRRILDWGYTNSRLLGFLDERLHIQRNVKGLRSDRVPIKHYLLDRNRAVADPPDSDYRRLESQIVAEARRRGTSKEGLTCFLDHSGFSENELFHSHWNVSARAFRELKVLSERHGFEVTVVILPLMQEMERYPLRPLHRFLVQEFEKLGFRVLDPLDEITNLYKYMGTPALTFDAVHFNKPGAVAFSRVLFEKTGFILGN